MTRIAAACAALVVMASAMARAADQAPVFDVPRMEGVRIDGDLSDWGQKGYHAGLLTAVGGRATTRKDFDAAIRLGWDERGMLAAAKVWDDAPVEAQSEGDIWQCDSIEVFLAEQVGSAGWTHAAISPGLDPRQPQVRVSMAGHGTLAGADLRKATVARQSDQTGYTVEILMPWHDVGVRPETGRLVGFQIWLTDSDGAGERPAILVWCPRHDTPKDSKQMHAARLALEPSPTPRGLRATAAFDPARLRATLTVVGSDGLAGKTVAVAKDGRTVLEGSLRADACGQPAWRQELPAKAGVLYGPAQLILDGQAVETVDLPNVAKSKAEAFVRAAPAPQPSVFYGQLPPVEFEQPLWAEQIIGPYEIDATYYDQDYNVVTRAEKPGRYGAVTMIRTPDGRVFKRFVTLFAMPKRFSHLDPLFQAPLKFADELRIRPELCGAFEGAINEWLNAQVFDQAQRTSEAAVLLAGLYGMTETPAKDDFWSHPDQVDRQWWLGLKRRLYGWDKRWGEPVVAPRPIEGEPAPVVREGTPEEAGMKPDAAARIDAVLTEWSQDTDEAFAVCIARHGVIVLHKAYGLRDGKPMTVKTPSWMASITKMMSGTLMMMLVDQGRIDLDDPVEKYLPPLRDVKTNVPLTIRHCYTHTSGLDWHWGDFQNDMEERIAFLLPHLEIGRRYFYNGTGMALACKALEAVSGETLPAFYKKHLLGPLGCANTVVAGASGDAMSVPLDMARIAQMLLNKGAYGNLRFLREETFTKMLPVKLTRILGPETDKVYGIGTMAYPDEGLGKDAFAHGAASSAYLRIDPTNDLVIVMTRNAAGKNYEKYHPRFVKAILAGLPDGQPPAASE